MKGRHATSCACVIQLLCATNLIHNLVGAAPQGLVSGARFVPDFQKNFNNLPQNSGLVLPGIQLNGPNFISALHSENKPTITNSRPQEPIFTISQPLETTINRSQPPQPTISFSQPQEPTIFISQPLETTFNTFQPPQPIISFSQPQFTNQNVLPANSQVPQQSVFTNQQPPVNNFINVQPVRQAQQPEFTLRSQSANILPQQQNFVNTQPILLQGVQESFTVIREDETALQPQEKASVGSPVNQVGSVNGIENLGVQVVSTGGASSLVSFLPEDQVVELPIPFFTNPETISVGPVSGNTFNQNQFQQDHNSVQPQTIFVDSSAKNLDSVNFFDTQTGSFVKRGPSNLESIGSTFDGNTQTGEFALLLPSEDNNKMGIPLSSVVSVFSESNNVGAPISSTTNLDNVNKNMNTPQGSEPNTLSGANSIGVPLSSTVNIATEDNTLRSSQSPTSDADLNLIASLSSAINNDASFRSALISASGNTASDFGSQTLGEVLLSMNGQDGIIVLPMNSLRGGAIPSELLGGTNNNDVTFRADDGTSNAGTADAAPADTDLGSILDTFIEDYASGFDDDFVDLPPAPTSPPNLFRSTLADTLFVKGQFLGTLLGGLLDLGGAITGQFKDLKPKS